MTAPKPPPGQDPHNPANIEARYGFVGQMAKTIPELRGILQQASREQWTTDRFLMTVANTNWYKTNGAAVREWMTLEATDPQTARDRKGHLIGDIYARANRLGIRMSPQQAEQAFYFIQFSGGMSEENIDGYLGRTFFDAYSPQFDALGEAGEFFQGLDQMRHAYGMDDEAAYRWVRDNLNSIMRGETTIEAVKHKAINYARSRWSQYAERLEAGETMLDIAQPRIDVYRDLLEQDPASGIHDPLIMQSLEARGPDGKPVDEPTWAFAQRVRKDARWGKTNNAKQSMAEFVTKLGQDWGFVA